MNTAFERFVRNALRATLGVNTASFPDQPPRTHLDQAEIVPLKPDLCLLDDGRIVWVGDAKYKRLPVGGYRKADLYQLLAYAVSLKLPSGTLADRDRQTLASSDIRDERRPEAHHTRALPASNARVCDSGRT